MDDLAWALAAGVLSGMFLLAGIQKLRVLDASGPSAVAVFGVTGASARLATIAICALEIVVAILIWIPATRQAALLSAVGMLIAFTMFLAYLKSRRPNTSCACFGSSSQQPVNALHLVRNLLLMSFLGVAIGFQEAQVTVESIGYAIVPAVVICLLLVSFDALGNLLTGKQQDSWLQLP